MTIAYDEQAPLSLGLNYRKVWYSAAASNLADGIFRIALPLMAVSLTTEPLLIAGVAVAARLPWIFFVLFAGAIADRVDRRATMRNVQLLRVGIVALMAILAVNGALSLPMLYLVALSLGIGETFYDTAGMSIMPSIVPRALLSRANSRLFAVEMAADSLVGPPLGGFLVAVAIPVALTGSAIGYAIAAVGLTLVVGSFKPPQRTEQPSMLADIREGMVFLWRTPVLRTMAAMVAGFHFADGAVFAVFVLFVVAPGPMGLDEFGFGLLVSAFAVGGILGSLVAERVERRLGRARVILVATVSSLLFFALPLLTSEPVPIALGLVLVGVVTMWWNVVSVSMRQRITPDHLLGRLNAAYRFFGWGAGPLGAIAGGVIAQVLGVPATFALAALVMVVMLWVRHTLTDQAIDEAIESAESAADQLVSEAEA